VAPSLVPGACECIIKRSKEVYKENEAVELVGERIGRIISESGEFNCGLESQGALALDGIRSVFTLSV
jgi:hypothetical protein